MFYAQLNELNICVGISQLNREIPEYNYSETTKFNPITNENVEGESIFQSRMIQIQVFSDSYIGLHYNEDGSWNEVNAH